MHACLAPLLQVTTRRPSVHNTLTGYERPTQQARQGTTAPFCRAQPRCVTGTDGKLHSLTAWSFQVVTGVKSTTLA